MSESAATTATLFLAGDVMTGRGVDQLLPHPCDPELHERYVQDAREYLSLAEFENGPLPESVEPDYIWGEGLAILEEVDPEARIVNLETSITRSDEFWSAKGIHYRMSPENAEALAAVELDVCSLANNHVLDWGYTGLEETIATLDDFGIGHCGAGKNLLEARQPAIVDLDGDGRVLVYGLCAPDAGVFHRWAATEKRPGVFLIESFIEQTAEEVGALVEASSRAGDIVVASIHWGGNWGYQLPERHIRFGRALVDEAGVDLVHGHSSHHVKGFEIYRDRPILYGCGDLITDYEGIGGHEQFRGELGMMYFPRIDLESGQLLELEMRPTRLERVRLNRPLPRETEWLADLLNRESGRFGTRVEIRGDDRLVARWS